jgi:hypothetical protein
VDELRACGETGVGGERGRGTRTAAVHVPLLFLVIVYKRASGFYVKRCGQIAEKGETPIAVVKADKKGFSPISGTPSRGG